MGAWSADSFGNDDACDWVDELEGEDDLDVVTDALEIVLEEDDYLDADDACEAIAACEVLARLKGNWGLRNSYSEVVDKWVAANPIKPPPEVIQMAIQTLDRIEGEQSELRELWEDSDPAEWRLAMQDLRRRLQT
jgi:hypothetical protein